MRMYADCGENEIVLLRNLDGAVECARAVSGTNREDVSDSCLASTGHDLLAIRIEARAIEVAVGVDEHGNRPCRSNIRVRVLAVLSLRAKNKIPRHQTRMSDLHGLFQPRPQRHIFQKACQDRLPAFK